MIKFLHSFSLILLVCAGVASCEHVTLSTGTESERIVLTSVSFEDLPGWKDDLIAEALPALLRSCTALVKLPERVAIGNDGIAGTAVDWIAPCRAAERVPSGSHDSARRFFEQWFDPFLVSDQGETSGLFTGYYEIELKASRRQWGRYQTPLLGKPTDLVTADLGLFISDLKKETVVGRIEKGRFRPYPTRVEIQAGAIVGSASPILWVDDPVDAFLLHIQGSGKVTLDDGSQMRVGYKADNGHQFVGISGIMRSRGLIAAEQQNMPAIQAWMRAHPVEARELEIENPRYIFFRLITGDGPIGAEGVVLTPQRSMAVDPKFIPFGVPIWLDTADSGGHLLQRLVIAQDSGNAIKGPVRGDFFWGTGEQAFEKAGRMKSRGRYFILIPRSRTTPVAGEGTIGMAQFSVARHGVLVQ